MLSQDDLAQYQALNATTEAFPFQIVPELIDSSIARFPDRIALRSTGYDDVTYIQLGEQIHHACGWLHSIGVRPGDLVAVSMERQPRLVVMLLALLKVGAAYVPIDPDYPSERIKQMLNTANAKAIICGPGQDSIFPKGGWGVFEHCTLDLFSGDVSKSELCQCEPGTLAYVIFTSGSTGLPKGVMIHQAAMANFIQAMTLKPGLNADTRLLAITTLSFDIAVLELFAPLVVGGLVYIASAEEARDLALLAGLIKQQSINVMQATPATWRLLIGYQWAGCDGLKVLCGGEAFPRELAEKLLPIVDEVWNMYGPTETTVWSTCYKIAQVDGSIPVGVPIANTSCYVVDENNEPVPPGQLGELVIGGNGVALGYLNLPEQTGSRFKVLPHFGNKRFYFTGDSAFINASGVIEYQGRTDFQVKVRGYRIELEEIEAAIETHPSVVQCVAVVRSFGEDDDRIVAHIKFDDLELVTDSEFRRYLEKKIPNYMIPQHYNEVITFPLTLNGKVDRKSLSMPAIPLGFTEDSFGSISGIEEQILKDWAELLKVPVIGLECNFLDLGGNSLLLTEFRQRVEHRYQVQLSVNEIALSTIAQLAELIEQRSEGQSQKSSGSSWTKIRGSR